MYPLNKKEQSNIDKFWEFIDIFINILPKDYSMYSIYNYNIELRTVIKSKYNVDEFYFYEKILNKLLFNLLFRYKIKYEHIDNSAFVFNLSQINGHSYSNKLLLFNEKSNTLLYMPHYIYIKKYQSKLYNLIQCLTNKKLYEISMKLINYEDLIKEINKYKIYDTYYPLDYPFPNVNLLFYNENNKKTWIKNIKRLIYSNKWNDNICINFYLKKICI